MSCVLWESSGGVQLWRNAALGEAGCTEIAPRSPLTALRLPFLHQDWSWKVSNIYNNVAMFVVPTGHQVYYFGVLIVNLVCYMVCMLHPTELK